MGARCGFENARQAPIRCSSTPVRNSTAPAATATATAPPPDQTKRKPRPHKPTPVQDEWGFFDPEQCGFAALLAKLDEITENEDTGKRRV